MAQEEWHDESIGTLFKTKANFRRQRKRCKAVYNGRAVFMKFNKLNVATVKDAWGRLTEAEKLHWSEVARKLNLETAD